MNDSSLSPELPVATLTDNRLSSRPAQPSPAISTSAAKIKTSLEMVTSNWCQSIQGLYVTPSKFYEDATRAVQERKIPNVEFSRVFWKESAFGGAEREYLRITRGRFVYDICAAQYGDGSFVSSWLCIVPFTISAWHLVGMFLGMIFFVWFPPIALYFMACLAMGGAAWWMYFRSSVATSAGSDILLGLTGLGPILKVRAEGKPTYYQLDAAAVFQTAVQRAVMGVIDGMCDEQQVRPLSELERKPVAREFLKK